MPRERESFYHAQCKVNSVAMRALSEAFRECSDIIRTSNPAFRWNQGRLPTGTRKDHHSPIWERQTMSLILPFFTISEP